MVISEITVILNVYKRPHTLEQQIEALKEQTIKPKDIWIWHNNPEDRKQIDLSEQFGQYKIIRANHNFKFHARFALGLLAKTKYVAFFDDDTIPSPKWFENCMNTINDGYDGILGTTGVVLHSPKYTPNHKVGWNGRKNTTVEEVDLVGHGWFMNKDHLRYLFYEEPHSWHTGEDMQLSYLAQKYGNIKTFVPPHPKKDKSVWGSKPDTGMKYGTDQNSTWRKSNSNDLRNIVARKQILNGWKPKNIDKWRI